MWADLPFDIWARVPLNGRDRARLSCTCRGLRDLPHVHLDIPHEHVDMLTKSRCSRVQTLTVRGDPQISRVAIVKVHLSRSLQIVRFEDMIPVLDIDDDTRLRVAEVSFQAWLPGFAETCAAAKRCVAKLAAISDVVLVESRGLREFNPPGRERELPVVKCNVREYSNVGGAADVALDAPLVHATIDDRPRSPFYPLYPTYGNTIGMWTRMADCVRHTLETLDLRNTTATDFSQFPKLRQLSLGIGVSAHEDLDAYMADLTIPRLEMLDLTFDLTRVDDRTVYSHAWTRTFDVDAAVVKITYAPPGFSDIAFHRLGARALHASTTERLTDRWIWETEQSDLDSGDELFELVGAYSAADFVPRAPGVTVSGALAFAS